ncbi:hypothetical protein DFS33DRAFT_122319 [Desarmillaria ectypa]|nr:hypothetical protein DFS33DRAFT_122319 [Desarmillaria ectypa]
MDASTEAKFPATLCRNHLMSFEHAYPTCTLSANLSNYDHILSTNGFSVLDNLYPYINDNFYPTPAICIEINQSLGQLTKQSSCSEELHTCHQNAVSQVAFILKKYEEAYAKTRSEQLRVQEIMDRHKAALFPPIRSLPDDILAVIFQLASPNAAFMDKLPWIATRVCRPWRNVAHSNRMLWSEFNLDSLSITPLFSSDGWSSST